MPRFLAALSFVGCASVHSFWSAPRTQHNNQQRQPRQLITPHNQDSGILKSYLGDANQLWGDGRQFIIETLDLGNNELRKEVERLGTMAPFNKFDLTSKNREFDALDMDQILNAIETEAPLLLRVIRSIMAPEHRRIYPRQKEPAA